MFPSSINNYGGYPSGYMTSTTTTTTTTTSSTHQSQHEAPAQSNVYRLHLRSPNSTPDQDVYNFFEECSDEEGSGNNDADSGEEVAAPYNRMLDLKHPNHPSRHNIPNVPDDEYDEGMFKGSSDEDDVAEGNSVRNGANRSSPLSRMPNLWQNVPISLSNISNPFRDVITPSVEAMLANGEALNRCIKVVKYGNKNKTEIVSLLFNTGTGVERAISNLVEGDVSGAALGVAQAVTGGLQLYKLIDKFQAGPSAQALLAETQETVNHIQKRQEQQRQHIAFVQRKLEQQNRELEEAAKTHNDINELATYGFDSVAVKKREALKISQNAVELFRQAGDAFDSINRFFDSERQNLLELRQQLDVVFEDIESLKEGNSDLTPAELADKIMQTLLNFQKSLNQTLDRMEQGQRQLEQALECLEEAKQLKDEAKTKFSEALKASLDVFKAISSRVSLEKPSGSEDPNQQARECVEKLQENHAAQERDIEEVKENLTDVQKILNNKTHWRSRVTSLGGAGVGAAAATLASVSTGPLIFGTIGAGLVAQLGYDYLKKNVRKKDRSAKKITGSPSSPLAFNPQSTGWGGRLRSVVSQLQGGDSIGSRTVGTYTLELHGENIPCTFNKNASDGSKMDPKSRQHLCNILNKALAEGKITHKECLEILDALAEVQDSDGNICLIARDCSDFEELRGICISKLPL